MNTLGRIVGAAAVLLVGCGPASQNPPSPPGSADTNTSVKDVGKQAQEAVTAARRFLVENKDHLASSMNDQLQEWTGKINQLARKVGNLTGEGKDEAEKAMEDLRVKRSQAAQKLEAFKRSSQEAWAASRADVDAAIADLQKAYEDARAKFDH